MSSIVGFQGMPFAASYAATKAYVQTLAEALHVEGKALKPEDIAQPILDALGRKSTILPGFLSRLLRYSLVLLPRWARVRIMGRVMQGMTKHRRMNRA